MEQEQVKMTEDNSKLEASDNINNNHNENDLEKQFYNELRRASMIIDLQQHYRLHDGLKNKEDLKQEIIEGYNALNNKNYSSEDLPDFQYIEDLLEVEAKMIDASSHNKVPMNSNLTLLENINKATKNNLKDETDDNNDTEQINSNNNDNENENNTDNKTKSQLINDTWKFLFNNPYSLQFLSKSSKSTNEKLPMNSTEDAPITEAITEDSEKRTERNIETEMEASTSKDVDLELNNSLMSTILKKNVENEEEMMKKQEMEEKIRKNKENDWLSFVQKELASMNINTSTPSKNNMKENSDTINKDKKVDYSKFIPKETPVAPKFEFTIEQNE